MNLGVKDANPSSVEGVIKIMEWLQELVPKSPDGAFKVMPSHADQLSVERMVDAQKARSCEESDAARLLGLEPTPQEFHHRGITIQVYYNASFFAKSMPVKNCCTLYPDVTTTLFHISN